VCPAACDTLLTVASGVWSILIGLLLITAAALVAKGYGMRYEGWMIRTVFRKDPDTGAVGQWRGGRFYRFWQVGFSAAFLAFGGIFVFISGILRLLRG
jgi:hypothetical protein